MTVHGPFGLGDDVHEIAFDFFGVGVSGEAEALIDAGHVSIDGEAGHFEAIAEDDVGCFSSDAGELSEFFHGAGHLAAVVAGYGRCHAFEAFCLVAKKSCGAHEVFEVFEGSFRHGVGIGIFGEEGRRHDVDSLVCALGA